MLLLKFHLISKNIVSQSESHNSVKYTVFQTRRFCELGIMPDAISHEIWIIFLLLISINISNGKQKSESVRVVCIVYIPKTAQKQNQSMYDLK